MPSGKRNNNNKTEGSPGGTSNAPGGGTSNAGNKSPADSLFSDGELLSPINQDVKPIINQPVDKSSGDFDSTFEQLARLMNSLSEQGQENLMTAYAEHAGFTRSKTIQPPTNCRPNYPDAYQNVDMSSGMLSGHETPMAVGFCPNQENFSRRAEIPLTVPQ